MKFRNFAKLRAKNLFQSLFLNEAEGWRPVIMQKGDSATFVFIWILQNIWQNTHFVKHLQAAVSNFFLRISKWIWSKSETNLKQISNKFKASKSIETNLKKCAQWSKLKRIPLKQVLSSVVRSLLKQSLLATL